MPFYIFKFQPIQSKVRLPRCFYIFFCFLTVGFAQKFQYTLFHGEGVPFSKVNQVTSDSREYIWIASDEGLFRYNGLRFEDFNTHLKSRYINSISHWKKDTLLFANDEGLHKLFYKLNEVQVEPFLETDLDSAFEYPHGFFMDSKDRIWIGQRKAGLYLLEANGKGRRLSFDENQFPERSTLAEDKYGTVWALLQNQGLYYFDEASGDFKKHSSVQGINHFLISGDTFWMVGDRILKWTMDANRNVVTQTEIGRNGKVFSLIAEDKNGTFFVNSNDGLYILDYNSTSNSLKKVFGSNDPHRIEELPFSEIQHLYFTPSQIRSGGDIWVSTVQGLGMLGSSYFQSVSGMPHDNVFSICSTKENKVLISHSDVNLVNHSGSGIQFEVLKGLNKVTGISNWKDNIWYGTSDGDLLHYKDGRPSTSYDLSNRGGGIFYLFSDHSGNTWFCQAPSDKPITGVGMIDNHGNLREYGLEKGLKTRILVLDEGGRSELYAAGIGSEHYLYKYNPKTGNFEDKSLDFPFTVSTNFEVHDIAVDDTGIVWMGTTDGLLKYDTERIQRIHLGDLTKEEVRSVCSLPDGNLWLATDTSGVIHLDSEGNYVVFDENSGTPSKVTSYRSMISDGEGRIWIGTAEGAVYSFQSNPQPLVSKSPILETFHVNQQSISDLKNLAFPESTEVRFGLVPISFPGTENLYQYKMYSKATPMDEAVNIPWSIAFREPELKLNQLSGGAYTLLVRTQQPGGYQWSEPLGIDFTVTRPWFKTFWGIGLLVIAGVLFFWYYVRIRVLSKTKGLQLALNQKQDELDAKEAALNKQSNQLQNQQEEIKQTGTNVYLLSRLLRQIPSKSTWATIMPVLNKLLEQPTGIAAFELAQRHKETIKYLGYRINNDELQKREEEFNEKENMVSYVLVANKSLLLGDYSKEAGQYIAQKNDGGRPSRIYIPFEQESGKILVLCIYGSSKNTFSERHFTLLQILATFLATNVIGDLEVS